MAHPEQNNFIRSVKEKFPENFRNCRVLEIGSLDLNGSIRPLFENTEYIGIDLGEGKGVDVISLGHEFRSEIPFDTVISCESLEHDMHWDKTILNSINLTKPKGLYCFTAATTGRQEHGTTRTSPTDSPFTHEMFNNYYKNITQEMVEGILGFKESFTEYEFSFHQGTKDIYFWGIKK